MKNPLPFLLAISLLSVSTFAQTRSRVFDNFDVSGGITIVSPTAAQTPAVKSKTKSLVKKTSKATMSVQDGLGSTIVPNSVKLVMGNAAGMNGFTTGNAQYDSYIVESSRRYNIDPLLIYSQMHQESSFKLRATSYKGASGLMQLMPATARRFGVTDIYDPKQNIDAGVRYMRWLLNTFGGDVVLALAGYNAGEGAVWKYGNQVPPYRETQEYVRRITARYNSISNPSYIRSSVKKVSSQQAVKLEKKENKPLTVYEPDALAIRLPDGRMRLVNQ
ncbi:MAG: lytic transglycosylase domain-containing protein [Acidobacteria bacterium]|nr:lytic transglycosylase domain-containing protein [Acidobacteriota bacterium]MBK8148252.1 lytic transglycosylase domain-containing protein [Acidobacteriota bacterium]